MQEPLNPERPAAPPPGRLPAAPPPGTGPAAPPPTTSSASRVAARGAGSVLLAVAALVAVGGVTFAVGRLTAPAAATTRGPGGGTGNGAFPGGQGVGRQGGPGGLAGSGGLTVRGTVTATTPSGITIQLANGTTVTIPTDGSTTYHRQAAASAGDVATGNQVLVELGGGQGGQGAAGQGPNASPSPGASPRLGPARDVTIVAP